MRAQGMGWRKISQELGVPVSTLFDACTKNAN